VPDRDAAAVENVAARIKELHEETNGEHPLDDHETWQATYDKKLIAVLAALRREWTTAPCPTCEGEGYNTEDGTPCHTCLVDGVNLRRVPLEFAGAMEAIADIFKDNPDDHRPTSRRFWEERARRRWLEGNAETRRWLEGDDE
jgi:hypothetical protein